MSSTHDTGFPGISLPASGPDDARIPILSPPVEAAGVSQDAGGLTLRKASGARMAGSFNKLCLNMTN
jgi:hypothetical protein